MKILTILALILCMSSFSYAADNDNLDRTLKISAESIIDNPDGSVTYFEPRIAIPQTQIILPIEASNYSSDGACAIEGKLKVRYTERDSYANDTAKKIMLDDNGSIYSFMEKDTVIEFLTCK